MPVFIRIDGKPELWGSPRIGLSPFEQHEYNQLLARHDWYEDKLHTSLGSGSAAIRRALRRKSGVNPEPEVVQRVEQRCQETEKTRRALRRFLDDPDASVEWDWRYWVGRELAEMRGFTGCIEITPGVRTAWGSNAYAHRPGLSPHQRAHAEILLEKWSDVLEKLRRAYLPFAWADVFDHSPTPLSIRSGGLLLSEEYAYEKQLLAYSAYPSVIADLPLPANLAQGPFPTVSSDTRANQAGSFVEPKAMADDVRVDFGTSGERAPGRRGRFPSRAIFVRDVGEAVKAVGMHGSVSLDRVAAQMNSWAEDSHRQNYDPTSPKAILAAGKVHLGLSTWREMVPELSG